MIKAYSIIAHIIAGVVALQAASIAMAGFGGSEGYDWHAWGARLIVVLAVALLAVAFAVRGVAVPWALGVLGLALVQYGLGEVAEGRPWLGFAHGFLAMALFGVSQMAAGAVKAAAVKGSVALAGP